MHNKVLLSIVGVLLLSSILIACSGGQAEGPITGDPERGEKLYNQATLGSKSAEGCATCHLYDESEGDEENAPYTAGTATRAASRVPGLSVEEYIRESIVSPDAYVVEGWLEGDMYQEWEADLSEQDLADLIAYILTEE